LRQNAKEDQKVKLFCDHYLSDFSETPGYSTNKKCPPAWTALSSLLRKKAEYVRV